jgi:hypothetical protein
VMSSAWFPPSVTLGIQAKDFNLVSHGQCTLGSFWQAPSGMSCLLTEWRLSGHSTIRLIGGVLQRWLSFWKVLPSPKRSSGAL